MQLQQCLKKFFQSQPHGIGASDAELLCQLQAENEALKAENDSLKLQVAELQNYRGKLAILTYSDTRMQCVRKSFEK